MKGSLRGWKGWLCLLLGLCACGSSNGPSKWGGFAGAGGGGSTGGGNVPSPTCTPPAIASLDAPNVVELTVDPGPAEAVAADQPYANGLFATIKLCVPGTTNCQTIDHLLVDTGSVGIRVLGSVLTLPLPSAKTDTGALLGECLPFVDSDAWGLVKSADVQIGGEFASNIRIQVIGDTSISDNIPIPAACDNNIITELVGDQGLGTNGILGVGLQQEDCGANCIAASSFSVYYACSTTCKPFSPPVAQQLPNPTVRFPTDNNGVIIQLPCIPEMGAPSVSGAMVFGIGTQANNDLGSATRMTPSSVYGYVTTAFPADGEEYEAILDTGSNGLFFLDAKTSGLKACPGKASQWYCPPSTTNLTATLFGGNNEDRIPVVFSVASLMSFPDENYAFNDLAGSFPGYPQAGLPSFDWGLPFHFGRSVYVAIEGKATSAGVGPYFAF
jgi:hypothetical protein